MADPQVCVGRVGVGSWMGRLCFGSLQLYGSWVQALGATLLLDETEQGSIKQDLKLLESNMFVDRRMISEEMGL